MIHQFNNTYTASVTHYIRTWTLMNTQLYSLTLTQPDSHILNIWQLNIDSWPLLQTATLSTYSQQTDTTSPRSSHIPQPHIRSKDTSHQDHSQFIHPHRIPTQDTHSSPIGYKIRDIRPNPRQTNDFTPSPETFLQPLPLQVVPLYFIPLLLQFTYILPHKIHATN